MIKRFLAGPIILMSLCGSISKNQKHECDKPLTGGARDKVFIFNFDDIDTLTRDTSNPQIIRDINLKGTAKGFYWEGPANSVFYKAALVRKKYKPTYEHLVGVALMKNNSGLKEQLEKAGHGKFVVIVENNDQSGDAIFEIYFLDRGGIILKNERDSQNADTEGGYDLNFGQEDTARESKLPATFAVLSEGETPVYSYAATKAALEALITVDA